MTYLALYMILGMQIGFAEDPGPIDRFLDKFDYFAVVDVRERPYGIEWLIQPPIEARTKLEALLHVLSFEKRRPKNLYQHYFFAAKAGEDVLHSRSIWIRDETIEIDKVPVRVEAIRRALLERLKGK